MPHPHSGEPLSGSLITDEEHSLSLEQLCQRCNLPSGKITAYVQEGIVDVTGHAPEQWRFSYVSVVRIHKAVRLENDLHLNTAGAALALDLMDQVEALQNRLRLYENK